MKSLRTIPVSGTAVGSSGPDTTTFFITLFDANFNPYSTGPGGAIGTIDINPDGSTTPTTYGPIMTTGRIATIPAVSSTPEPGSLTLLAIGGILSLAARWRQRAGRGRTS